MRNTQPAFRLRSNFKLLVTPPVAAQATDTGASAGRFRPLLYSVQGADRYALQAQAQVQVHAPCALAEKAKKIAVSFALAATARPSSIIHLLAPIFGESRHREDSSIFLCLLCCDPLHRPLHVCSSKKVRRSIVPASSLIAICNLQRCAAATPGAGADIRVQRENTNSRSLLLAIGWRFRTILSGPKSTSTHLCSSVRFALTRASSSFAVSETRIINIW